MLEDNTSRKPSGQDRPSKRTRNTQIAISLRPSNSSRETLTVIPKHFITFKGALCDFCAANHPYKTSVQVESLKGNQDGLNLCVRCCQWLENTNLHLMIDTKEYELWKNQ